jgi:hypothetical protein
MYRIKSTGEIKTQGEVRRMFPNTSLPRVWDEAVCNHLGIDPIFESPTPTTTRYQIAHKNGVEFKTLTASGCGRGQSALPLPSTRTKKV